MSRMVKCIKLGQELPGMKWKPFAGELGQRLFNDVSAQAWHGWLEHSKILINEYRLDLMSPQAQKFLREECEKYFYGENQDVMMPAEYTPEKE